MILLTVACVVLGAWSALVQPFRNQAMATDWVRSVGGSVEGRMARGPAWQRLLVTKMLGEEHFTEVTKVTLLGADDAAEAEQHLAAFDFLEELTLDGSAVGDGCLAAISRAESLQSVSLRYTAVTDTGMQSLARLPALKVVRLTGADITDAGLLALIDCKSLTSLFLRWTQVTPEAIASFRAQRSDCAVHYHARPPLQAASAPAAPSAAIGSRN